MAQWINGSMFMTLTIMGAIGILSLRHAQTFKILIVGASTIAIGTSTILLGVHLSQATLLFMGAGVTGIGFGTGFMGAIRTVMPLAQPEQRAGLMATFYVISYLAFSIPAIIAGYFVRQIGLSMSATIYICMIIVLSGLAVFFAIQNKSKLS